MYKNIISINGAPRSGTSWLFQIFDSCTDTRCKFQPLKSISFSNAIKVGDTVEEINDVYQAIYDKEDDYLDNTKLKEEGKYEVFQKSSDLHANFVYKNVRYHYLLPYLLETVPNFKVVGIIRNPLSQLVSWKNAPKEFLPQWDFNEEWRFAQSYNKFRSEEYYGFHRWKEVAKLFLDLQLRYPDRVIITNYEDLVKNTVEQVKKLFEFTGLNYDEQTNDFLEKTKQVKVEGDYSVFKGNKDTDSWRNEIDSNIIEEVTQELAGTEFEQFLK